MGRREIGEERGREVGRREVGRRAGERGRGGEERHHMTTTVPCRGVSRIYIYTVHVVGVKGVMESGIIIRMYNTLHTVYMYMYMHMYMYIHTHIQTDQQTQIIMHNH